MRFCIASKFFVCKFNPTERNIHFRENWLIFLGIWGETELILGIFRAKAKYFQGAEEIILMDLGRSMHYFQGAREPRPSLGTSSVNSLYKAFRPRSGPTECRS